MTTARVLLDNDIVHTGRIRNQRHLTGQAVVCAGVQNKPRFPQPSLVSSGKRMRATVSPPPTGPTREASGTRKRLQTPLGSAPPVYVIKRHSAALLSAQNSPRIWYTLAVPHMLAMPRVISGKHACSRNRYTTDFVSSMKSAQLWLDRCVVRIGGGRLLLDVACP